MSDQQFPFPQPALYAGGYFSSALASLLYRIEEMYVMYDLKEQSQRIRIGGREKKVDFKEFFHPELAESVYATNEGIEERKTFKEVNK